MNFIIKYTYFTFVFLFLIFINDKNISYSYNTDEHIQIGMVAYDHACKHIVGQILSKKERLRHHIACEENSNISEYYGLSVALAADYIKLQEFPEDYEKLKIIKNYGSIKYKEGSELKSNLERLIKVGLLALKNSTHFHPEVNIEWLKYHNRVLDKAKNISSGKNVRKKFQEAFYISAFGDHFLQDSFSSGHIGIKRRNTAPYIVKYDHDRWSCAGRFLKNQLGEYWFSLGDGGLNKVCNKEGKLRVISANIMSVGSFLNAFIFGKIEQPQNIEAYPIVKTKMRLN